MRMSLLCIFPENCPTDVDILHTAWPSVMLRLLYLLNMRLREPHSGSGLHVCGREETNGSLVPEGAATGPSCWVSTNGRVTIFATIILPVVLYGCETWSVTLWEEGVLRDIFGANKDVVTGEWRTLHNEELCDLYC